jgi:hypothetical protein
MIRGPDLSRLVAGQATIRDGALSSGGLDVAIKRLASDAELTCE